jgi:glutamine synthetase
MAKLRFEALKKLNERTKVHVEATTPHISQFFGENVFGYGADACYPGSGRFQKVSNAIKNHEKIDEATADAVASAAKSWAIVKGATHFTHWFPTYDGRNR